jgi:hypothetical protein
MARNLVCAAGVRTDVSGHVTIDVLRVKWDTTSGSAVASLVGGINADAGPVLEGLGRVAQLAPNLVVDLGRVTSIDRAGLDLVMGLGCIPNVTVRMPSAPVSRLFEEILLAAA